MRCMLELAVLLAWVTVAGCREQGASDDTSGDSSSTGVDESTGSDSSSEDGSSGAAWPSLEERPCPTESALTWENFGGGYVLSYCTSCHHSALPADMRRLAPLAVNFETVELVRNQATRVWARAADQNSSMPPLGAPGPDDRALLGEWLACGAPTNADLGME